MIKNTMIVLLAVLLAGCTKQPAPDLTAPARSTSADNGDGRRYLDELVAAIGKAERIVVTEHSIAYDMLDPAIEPQLPLNYQPVIYASADLTAAQRAAFLVSIRNTAPSTQDAFTSCTFEPHHTITFYEGGKQASAMDICFQCGEIEWNGSKHNNPPWALITSLRQFIASVGMKDKREWRVLAQKK